MKKYIVLLLITSFLVSSPAAYAFGSMGTSFGTPAGTLGASPYSSSETPTPTPTPTPALTPTSESSKQRFAPALLTESVFNTLANDFSANGYPDLEGLKDNPDLVWSATGGSRAFLTFCLASDVHDKDERLLEEDFEDSSEMYVALIPEDQADEGYYYDVFVVGETGGITMTYTPNENVIAYQYIEDLTQDKIDNISSIAAKVWKLNLSDFMDMLSMFGEMDGWKNLVSSDKDNQAVPSTPKPTHTPAPTPTPTQEYKPELTESKAKSLAIDALLSKIRTTYMFSYDTSKTTYSISSVSKPTTQSHMWHVNGSVTLYDKNGVAATGKFKVSLFDKEYGALPFVE